METIVFVRGIAYNNPSDLYRDSFLGVFESSCLIITARIENYAGRVGIDHFCPSPLLLLLWFHYVCLLLLLLLLLLVPAYLRGHTVSKLQKQMYIYHFSLIYTTYFCRESWDRFQTVSRDEQWGDTGFTTFMRFFKVFWILFLFLVVLTAGVANKLSLLTLTSAILKVSRYEGHLATG